MSFYTYAFSTANPANRYNQRVVAEFMKERVALQERTSRIIHRIYSQSHIDWRHSVIPDLGKLPEQFTFFSIDEEERFSGPSTGIRNDWYVEHARELYVSTSREALAESGLSKEEITHVITISCTGFYAPGPDYDIVRGLGLSSSTQRFHIGFMGCYAVFPALRMAESICASNPNARILIASCELCSIHLQFKEELDSLLSASVFADGAGAFIASAEAPSDLPYFKIKALQTHLTDEGEEDMAWKIGDDGFDMILSSYVPKIIEANTSDFIQPLLDQFKVSPTEIPFMAVHPGGRSILDKVEQTLGLLPKQLKASRSVLRNFGNMSSATILFILKEILEESENGNVVAMAFGPGLTVETGFFEKLGA